MSTFETKDLLQDTISTTPQAFATKVKAPCTGFCYMVIENKDTVIDLYLNKKTKEYGDFILGLIIAAADRKENNEDIHVRGEYINQETVLKDFSDIMSNMKFQEFNTVDPQGSEYATNTLFLLILDLPIHGFVMITRSQETFLLIKLSNDKLLVVDSHKSGHGTVNLENAIKYITRDKLYKGLIQIGYLSNA